MFDNVGELKESAASYLVRFEEKLPKLINDLRSANIRDWPSLADAAEGFEWLFKVAMIVTVENGAEMKADIDRITDSLSALEEALNAKDLVLVADILEFEMLDLAADWRHLFEA